MGMRARVGEGHSVSPIGPPRTTRPNLRIGARSRILLEPACDLETRFESNSQSPAYRHVLLKSTLSEDTLTQGNARLLGSVVETAFVREVAVGEKSRLRSLTSSHNVSAFLFCSSWIAFISLRKVRGMIVFFPFLKFRIAHLATLDCRERSLVENCFASVRICSRYFGSTTLSYSRQVSSAGSNAPASAIM